VSFRCESWIRNASDDSTLSVLIILRAVGSESALPIHTKEPSGLTRNTSRPSKVIVAPRRDKVTRYIRVTRIEGNGRWKTARRGDLSQLSILTGSRDAGRGDQRASTRHPLKLAGWRGGKPLCQCGCMNIRQQLPLREKRRARLVAPSSRNTAHPARALRD
jgi:hypothetical protein